LQKLDPIRFTDLTRGVLVPETESRTADAGCPIGPLLIRRDHAHRSTAVDVGDDDVASGGENAGAN
jgi:hypothetical protein